MVIHAQDRSRRPPRSATVWPTSFGPCLVVHDTVQALHSLAVQVGLALEDRGPAGPPTSPLGPVDPLSLLGPSCAFTLALRSRRWAPVGYACWRAWTRTRAVLPGPRLGK